MQEMQEDQIKQIERRVQRDEGNRGIIPIIPEEPQLFQMASAILEWQNICILTGYAWIQYRIPQCESDGPPGAIAIAATLGELGKDVKILVDPEYQDWIERLAQWAWNYYSISIVVISEIPQDAFDAVIAIERPGMASDGNYYTMKARNISNVTKPFDQTLFSSSYPAKKFAIGDGGNEAGLGSLNVAIREHIPLGDTIASTTCADRVLVASTSNWGGWALSLSLTSLSGNKPILSKEGEHAMAERLIEEGICDGILQEPGFTCDGLDWDTNAAVIKDLLDIIN